MPLFYQNLLPAATRNGLFGIMRTMVLKHRDKELQEQGEIRRVGADKNGHWEVLK